ncbi:hypothetical protein B0H12DRAFT_110539 [Mycena haematopus]|nr:hypothetical protein B0H12DRAFT_755819 [Mycena haematopus]KAJ7237319.1 hypothetical protein B0H12DRAFT_110539 [Mycena haematopus]
MSTTKFPRRRPVDDPPLPCGVLVNDRPTPTYALTWICDRRAFFMNLGGGTLGKVHTFNYTDAVSDKWEPAPGFNSMMPLPYPAGENKYLLIAMWNTNAEEINRARHPTEDPVVQAARVAVGVDQDPSLDKPLQWIRWPLDWFKTKDYARMMAESEENSD